MENNKQDGLDSIKEIIINKLNCDGGVFLTKLESDAILAGKIFELRGHQEEVGFIFSPVFEIDNEYYVIKSLDKIFELNYFNNKGINAIDLFNHFPYVAIKVNAIFVDIPFNPEK